MRTVSVAYVNWDPAALTTAPSPKIWINEPISPWQPQPLVQTLQSLQPYTITTTSTGFTMNTTTAEKAEVILAVLLKSVTDRGGMVKLLEDSQQAADVAVEVEDDDGVLIITVNETANFDEIIDSLYDQLANCRGRVLK